MSSGYFLRGVINTFNVIPDFVTPVFGNVSKNGFFIQCIGDNNEILLDEFSDFSDSFYLSKVTFYSIDDSKYEIIDLEKKHLPKNNNKKNVIYSCDLKKPIFGFQTESNILYGGINDFLNFLNTFETDDEYLKEEIYDFKENISRFSGDKTEHNINLQNKKMHQSVFTAMAEAHYRGADSVTFEMGSIKLKPNLGNIMKDIKVNSEFGNILEKRKSLKNPDSVEERLLEVLDRRLRNTHYTSDEYKNIIAVIYKLLFNNQEKTMKDFRAPFQFHSYDDKNE